MDIADLADQNVEAFNREAIHKHSQRIVTEEPDPVCMHCEENPAKVLANGLRLKFCGRCMEELELTNL